ncbi:hypothetical protein [Aestuariimicrobium sp. T2.26MG-19.2B]|uniref:hypothetical protein n=1 Tax=Aestuariimicrobium sp. T2.26MG-19.2B TaxID=3040679 RepID=UPI0024773A44|nr:hypothetical protein [Aestuariimicrobium sp. T2.26MG-19.2B]CAI9403411.1 hypothetical protein AESSP_00998 [Aestuariimicrobium sp. T2.26MG-19.2B]
MLTIVATLPGISATAVDNHRGLIWVAQADNTLSTVDFGGNHAPAVALSGPATGLALGDHLYGSRADGVVFRLDPDDPASGDQTVVDTRDGYDQLVLSPLGRAALVVTPTTAVPLRPPLRPPVPGPWGRPGWGRPGWGHFGPLDPGWLNFRLRGRGTLTQVDLDNATTSNLGFAGVVGVAQSSGVTYVATNPLVIGGGQVSTLAGATLTPIATGLPRVGRLGVSEDGSVVAVTHPASSEISTVTPATGTVERFTSATLPGTLLEVQGRSGGGWWVVTTEVIAAVDALADLKADPTIVAPSEPIFVGSWVKLDFDLGTSGLTPHEVRFEVPDGPDAGIVSHTRQDGAAEPTPLLVVGGALGVHKVVMIEIATGTELAHAEFEITDLWEHADHGPAGFVNIASSFGGDSGWGGGPGTPQNINTRPHTGTWRSLVLMVDTSSGRWPTTDPALADNRTSILQHVSTGFATGTATRSARDYYEENSNFGGAVGMTLGVHNSQTYGPINLPNAWGSYFVQTTNSAGVVTDNRFTSIGTTLQSIVTRGITDGVITRAHLFAVDVLIVVVASPDAAGGPPARFVWPHANDHATLLCGTNVTTDMRDLAFAYVPLDFAAHDGRHMHSTLSHELGHTLGLPDLYSFPEYSADIDGRLTSDWDMMAGSRNHLPHYTISNKMRMGWVDPGHLKLYNFQGSSAVAENVTLHAAELGAPPAGRVRAIEIRLGDGWNYYVEYRAIQAGADSDALLTDRRVVITDVTSDSFTAPMARPPIVFVRKDLDGDGPLLGNGADLEEKDPGTQMDLKVEVVSTDVDNAVVKVSYGSNGKPEPGIRPWTGDPDWQSPDIEVRNAKTAADPAQFNVPWLGHDNTVVAKVRNSGDLLARGVVVDFFVTEYTTGDGPWVPLGSDTRDIGPNAVVEFTAPWAPAAADGRHYCVIVRIRLYQDPGNLAIVDNNIFNNEARSNYTRFVSSSASPSSRVGAEVLLANPFSDSTRVFARVQQTHPQHRIFIDHTWVQVPANGQAPIKVWDEALWGHPDWWTQGGNDHQQERTPGRLYKEPNRVSISGWAARPFESDCGGLTLTGGVGMRVDAGRETRVVPGRVGVHYTTGQVVHVDDKSGVTSGGVVLIEVVSNGGKSFTVKTEVGDSGQFGVDYANDFDNDTSHVVVHYLGSYGAAACESERLPV